MKVLISSKERSKQSTTGKSSFEVEEFEKVRNFLFGESPPQESPSHLVQLPSCYIQLHNEMWDNIDIIEEES